MVKYIEIKGEKYYLWDEYSDRETAHEMALSLKKQTKTKYFITTTGGTLTTEIKHKLYLNKVRHVI